jgi:SAM-dependent methyltransferase
LVSNKANQHEKQFVSKNVYYNTSVKQKTILKLVNLNKQFYQTFGGAFAQTRQRIQPGVRAVLEKIPKHGNWLDLGCGSGALALEWLQQSRRGVYHGLDFSDVLLDKARAGLAQGHIPDTISFEFEKVNLIELDWIKSVGKEYWDGVLAFAVLHHIPDMELRASILKAVHAALKPGGILVHSEWQFHNSEKWMMRRQPWSLVGIDAKDIDIGDTLLDWRHIMTGQTEKVGLRYVHLFSKNELTVLAFHTGFKLIDEFESDGEGGNLGIYQIWQKQGAGSAAL